MARVIFVLPGFPLVPGGGHMMAYFYANALAAEGHSVQVVHLRPSDRRNPNRLAEMRTRLAYRLAVCRRPRWYELNRSIAVHNTARAASLRARDGSIYIAVGVSVVHDVVRLAASARRQGVYFIQGYEDFAVSAHEFETSWKLPLRKIVTSAWLRDSLRASGIDSELVPNAVDPESFPPGPTVSERPPQVLTMLSSNPWKRADLALRVYAAVREEAPGVRLVAFGVDSRPGDLPAYVEYHANPPRALLADLYRASQVFLCTSDREGFGLPAAEAMLSGAAVVSTANGGVPDLAGDSALYAEVGNARGLTEHVIAVLRNAEGFDALAAGGRVRLLAYSPDMAAQAFSAAVVGG